MLEKGMTLIELLIVIIIIAILSMMAAPSFTETIRNQKAKGESNTLFSLVYLARSEAIKRNGIVTICKSNDADQCGGNWTDGWLVFRDQNGDGSRNAGETLISTGRLGNNYQLSWAAFGSNNYIRFTHNGITLSQNGSFKLCPDDANTQFARAVVISKLARTRIPEDSNGDGVYEDAAGNALSCS